MLTPAVACGRRCLDALAEWGLLELCVVTGISEICALWSATEETDRETVFTDLLRERLLLLPFSFAFSSISAFTASSA